MARETKSCEKTKPKRKQKRHRIRNFFRVHKTRLKQLGTVAALSALVGIGSISPPKMPMETSRGAREKAAEISKTPLGEEMNKEQKEYLCEILTRAERRWVLREVSAAIGHQKFEPFMLEYLGIILSEQKVGLQKKRENIKWFLKILDYPGLEAQMVRNAIKDYESRAGDIGFYLHEHINYSILGAHMVRSVREEMGNDYKIVLEGMKKSAENPNSTKRAGLGPVQVSRNLEAVRSRFPGNAEEIYSCLEAYYSNPNFSKLGVPDDWETLVIAGQISKFMQNLEMDGEKKGIMTKALLKNPNFSVFDLDKPLATDFEKLIGHFGEGIFEGQIGKKMDKLLQSPLIYRSMLDPKNEFWVGKMGGWSRRIDPRSMIEAIHAFSSGEYAKEVSEKGETHARKVWKTFRFLAKRMGRTDIYEIGLVGAIDPITSRELFGEFCQGRGPGCLKAADLLVYVREQTGVLSENGQALGFIEEVLEKRQEEYAPYSALSALLHGDFDRFEYPGGLDALYNEGKKLAVEVGANGGIPTYLNFAYAIAEVGPEMAKRLHQEFGLVYFTRYSYRRYKRLGEYGPSLLKLFAQNIGNTNDVRPIFLMATGKADWNGAFEKIKHSNENFEECFRIMLVESGRDSELIEKISHVGSKYGKIKLMFLSGHGNARGVRLGEGFGMRNNLDIRDKNRMGELQRYFAARPQIMLNSCSTGGWNKGGIGHAIANAVKGAEVFAPKQIFDDYVLEFDLASKRIIRVDYIRRDRKVATNIFRERPPVPEHAKELPKKWIRRSFDEFVRERGRPNSEIERVFGGVLLGTVQRKEDLEAQRQAAEYMYLEEQKKRAFVVIAATSFM
ncbi:hypothetical protein GF412_01225 [Candidatus Micrarchaeota archaeon]|nr:hypothetical protein [Candidatus Micrarchaeota archaeon]MBD3417594.1 hypothetical protein [Candidatus Micrarchaeota archaeon]